MIYEFTYGGCVYDSMSVTTLTTDKEIEEHKEYIQKKYNLPYVNVTIRVL